MGMAAALKLRPILANVTTILAIEFLVASQALDLLAPLRTGRLAEKARQMVRRVSAQITADRRLDRDIARLAERVSAGDFSRILASSR
jgi:histidine ammonia-lyase